MSNTTKWTVALVVAVVISIALGFTLARRLHPDAAPSVAVPSGDGTQQTERRVLYWHDPMVPGAKFDKPGKSPFMDMQLVPVYADEVAGDEVRINPGVAQNLGIRLGKVERKALSQKISAVGSVSFDERSLEVVQARVTGYVTRLHVKAPLAHVRRQQPLADVLAPEWWAAQQDYLALLEATALSTVPIREAARQRLVVLGVPEATIELIEKERKAHAETTIVAPIDGIVTELSVREGASFAAGNPLARINGLSKVWVDAQISEGAVSLVTPQSTIEAHARAWPAQTFKGKLLALLPDVNLQTRTLTARVEIDNPDRKLVPGMFVSMQFSGAAAQPQLVVPSEAVIVTGARSVVITVRDDAFQVATVTIGAEGNGFSTILSGLAEGQSVVLSGQFLIDSEASLKSTLDRLTGPPTTNPDTPRSPSDEPEQDARP